MQLGEAGISEFQIPIGVLAATQFVNILIAALFIQTEAARWRSTQPTESNASLENRVLNTVRTVTYEWDDTTSPAARRAVVTLGLGYANSPIVAINA